MLVYFVNSPWEIMRLKKSVKTTGQQLNKTAPPRGTRKRRTAVANDVEFSGKKAFFPFFYYIVIITTPFVVYFPSEWLSDWKYGRVGRHQHFQYNYV